MSAVPKPAGLYIYSMAVIPPARGKRIGWLLLEQVEKYAVSNGFRQLLLTTTPFLLPAIELYNSFGFQRTKEGPYDLIGTPRFDMEKELLV